MIITITTNTNPEMWGSECDQPTADAAAAELARMAAEAAEEMWPDAQVEDDWRYHDSGETPRPVRVDDAEADVADTVIGTLEAFLEEKWTEALARIFAIYSRQIACGAAFHEGRQPSHDGEYMTLYWAPQSPEGLRWIISDNGGVTEITDGLPELRELVEQAEAYRDEDAPAIEAGSASFEQEQRQDEGSWAEHAIEIIEACLEAEKPEEYGDLVPWDEVAEATSQALCFMRTGDL